MGFGVGMAEQAAAVLAPILQVWNSMRCTEVLNEAGA